MSSGKESMLIGSGNLSRDALQERVVLITGAGRGIGLEAARALAWLGARLVIAEIDPETGGQAADAINRQYGAGRALFLEADVGSEAGIAALKKSVLEAFGPVDGVVNNATIAPMGAVADLPVAEWDASYRVNLRGPVLLARAFLPGMIERDSGVFVCVSSVGQACMGAYECFKAAQVHLAETLAAELEGTGVAAFTIAPGLVRTPGALAGIRQLAPLYGMSEEEFFALSEGQVLSAEAAGAGFAAAVVLAERYHGQEISAVMALQDAGFSLSSGKQPGRISLTGEQIKKAQALTRSVRKTLAEQSQGWQERGLFECQWMLRDFRKNAGMPVERWLESLGALEKALEKTEVKLGPADLPPLDALAGYYRRLKGLAAGYARTPEERTEHQEIITDWEEDVRELQNVLQPDH